MELPLELFLAYVSLPAFPLILGAVVIDIFSLLDFCDHGATAVPTRDEPLEEKVLLLLRFSVLPVIDKHFLDLVEQVSDDNRLMGPLVGYPVPDELSVVDRVG
ncbi:MAG: hypothetical protein CXR31_00405 [Geobacter sp.]|nr:MAG: hypothetical protein CXR31_00405 [Geobacter sp.]